MARVSQRCGLGGSRRQRRVLTNPGAPGQHKMKSSIHHRVDPRISDPVERDASKVVGVTPGEPLCLLRMRSEQPARGAQRVAAVSRGHKSRRGNEPGVVADPRRAGIRRRIRRTHPDKGPNGASCRRAQVNESGKFRKPDRTDPAPGEYPGAEERRRLCHLRPKRAGRETSDGKCQWLHREEAETEGEPGKERGRAALGSEVSGILHDQHAPCAQAAYPLENDTTLQGQSP